MPQNSIISLINLAINYHKNIFDVGLKSIFWFYKITLHSTQAPNSPTPRQLTGVWPQTDTFPHNTPGYFISPCAYCWPNWGWLGWLASGWPQSEQCIPVPLTSAVQLSLEVRPFSSRPLRGEHSTLIHHSVTQPLKEVVNMDDLWDGGPLLVGGVELRFWRDILNISHHFITGSDIIQSINPSINVS